ncbi:phosphotransferase family protein [Rhodococcus sp. 077-4]|uniref:phosphotransferase family protein n=1 Tax=Rhodococcus sp. 077-4 TaxID=2789271 RepID=UPI0039F5E819
MAGGITAEVRKLTVVAPGGSVRHLVLKCYVDSKVMQKAGNWLNRESWALRTLAPLGLSVPELVSVDQAAVRCEYPSLLMTQVRGSPVLTDEGVDMRVPQLAQQLVAVHRIEAIDRPQDYEVLTTADTVVVPTGAEAELWSAAIEVIREPVPPHDGVVVHRDFQPGNVLFDVSNTGPHRLTGVVDWAGTAWGPADLDVAHCSTNLALLHGPRWGTRFATAYEEAGGVLADTARARRYWRVRDALACSEELQAWVQPWREAGRTDLTPRVVEDRLDSYVSFLMTTSN